MITLQALRQNGRSCALTAVLCALGGLLLFAGEKAYLGVSLDGNQIRSVTPGSAAQKAGLKADDVILRIGRKKTETREEVIEAISEQNAGDSAVVKYKRAGKIRRARVTFGARPSRPQSPPGGRTGTGSSRHYVRKGEPLPKERGLKEGLKWIAAQQNKDGSFPVSTPTTATMRFPVAITSLAAMALMMDPDFKKQVDKALKFIIGCCHEDGYIYHRKPSFKGMWEHGFATQFLAEALIQKKKLGGDTKKIEDKLKRAVELIKSAQNLGGGWGYRAVPDPHAEVGPAAAMLDALLLSKRAGIPVEDRIIQKGLKSQCVLMLRPGRATVQGEWRSYSYEANAFVLASLLGWKNRPETSVYLEALGKVDPSEYFSQYTEQPPGRGVYWGSGYHTLGLYYTALAYRRLGGTFKKKFLRWHGEVVKNLTKCQNSEGAWKGWFGDVYGSAFACMTLAADTDKLEMFNAANEFATASEPAKPENPRNVTLAGNWSLKLNYGLEEAGNEHKWSGFDATVKKVGLSQGSKTWALSELQDLFPKTPVDKGSAWAPPGDFVAKLFSTFHPITRAIMEARVLKCSDGICDVSLRALVKFGRDGGPHILTTSMQGAMKVDAKEGKILSLELETVSGCIRVNRGRGGYVALNDVTFKVAGKVK